MRRLMRAYRIEKRVAERGQLHLSGLPFQEGEEVEVIVLSRDTTDGKRVDPQSLHGSVKRYDRPTDPVADDEWESIS